MQDYQKGTQCIHAGFPPGNGGEPRTSPSSKAPLSATRAAKAMGALFDLEAEGYFYTRLQNPTLDRVAAKICALEGGNGGHAHLFRPGGQLLRHLQPLLRRGTMWCPPPPSTGGPSTSSP